jgi:hypothetical protein
MRWRTNSTPKPRQMLRLRLRWKWRRRKDPVAPVLVPVPRVDPLGQAEALLVRPEEARAPQVGRLVRVAAVPVPPADQLANQALTPNGRAPAQLLRRAGVVTASSSLQLLPLPASHGMARG